MKTTIEILNNIEMNTGERDIYYLNETFKIIKLYAQKLKKDNPEITPQEVIDSLDEMIYKMIFEQKKRVQGGVFIKQNSITKGDLCYHKTLLHIKKYPNQIMDILDNSDKEKLLQQRDKFLYTDDMNSNINQVLQDIIFNYFESKNDEAKRNFIEGKMSFEQRNKLRDYIIECCTNIDKIIYDNIRIGYINRIISIASFLDKYGVLEQYCKDYNKKIDERKLDEVLKIEYDGKKGNKPKITSAKALMNRAAVEKLTMQELTALSSFLTNRIVKEDLDIRKVAFILEENGLMNKLFDDNFQINSFDNKKIKSDLTKFKFLQILIRKKMNNITNQINETILNGEDDERVTALNKVKVENGATETIKNLVQGEYEYYFEENTFERDFENVENKVTNSINLYRLKDYSVESLIILLLTNKKDVRWGYVPEIDSKGMNSIQRGERNILIACNFQGFNSTFALHISLESIIESAKQLTGSSTIPVFQGQEAMELDIKGKRKYATSMLLKFTKEQRAHIKKIAKNILPEDRNYKYIKHLNWLIEDTQVPSYLLDENGRLKEQDVDLFSGEIVSIEKNIEDK